MSILRQWLSHCNSQHTCCTSLAKKPPTILIDVGSGTDSTLRLYETRPNDRLDYIALSHTVGRPPYFLTTPYNMEAYKHNIPFETLPTSYQDAVMVTRELGIRFLWIDSICVIRGPESDFFADKETIFNQAYCVLAASSAKNASDGFLQPRKELESTRLNAPSNKAVIRVRKFIDDFDRYVLQNDLHQSAWSLQERALARRTIYFTSIQTFWECGHGVRCETMTKMYK